MNPRVFFAVLVTVVLAARWAAAEPSAALPRIPARTLSITEYGAVGDGTTLNTRAMGDAIAACEAAGGGVVRVPAGRWLTGPIDLVSHMELRLEEGATLLLTDSPEAYPIANNRRRHAIAAQNRTDIAITGKGAIDGNGSRWWKEYLKIKGKPAQKTEPRRPNLIDLGNCQRVLVQGVTIRNSPNFHLVPGNCDDVTIDGVTFSAPDDAPNTDALDPSGHRQVIRNCTFDVGDDCIAFKPSRVRDDGLPACQDLLVENCTFKHGHGLSIGGQTPGGLRGLIVRNCTFDGTEAGIRMKAARGAGGVVEDLVYENIAMRNVKVPIFISSYYPENITPARPHEDAPQPIGKTTPFWRGIRISNLTASDCPEAGRIIGLPEAPITDLKLTNVKLSAKKGLRVFSARVECENSRIDVESGPRLVIGSAQISGLE